jgi:hypothetical protein
MGETSLFRRVAGIDGRNRSGELRVPRRELYPGRINKTSIKRA